jgi:glutamate-1-semialdehyde 2,1-aminomutase
MNTENSKKLFAQAQNTIVGGVNSPVRAFRAVGGNPLFIQKAKGAYLYDVDDNAYIELINSWGPMILGHNPDFIREAIVKSLENSWSFGAPTHIEIQMAELIASMVPAVEKIRMVNSGTEACLSAIRVARGYTGKSKIIKFAGCYHGHADAFLIAAGSGAITFGTPDSAGVTQGVAQDTLVAEYNDLEAVENLVNANKNQVACIILEPVAGNMGLVLPKKGFLEGLRILCDKEGIVLVFDEVMTGFRLAQGGVQERFGVKADLITMGKIIGAGMPVGAYGGKKEIMDCVAPLGKVYQAGTLSGNPTAMTAGLAMLQHLKNNPSVYTLLDNIGEKLVNGMKSIHQKLGLNYTINHIGSMYTVFFTDKKIENFIDAQTSDTTLFGKYFRAMLSKGIYLAPSQYESLFFSTCLTDELISKILFAHEESLKEIN